MTTAGEGDMSTAERVLAVLVDVTRVDEVRDDGDLRLYESGVIDSLGTVELLLALTQEFSIEISPTEVDRERWATPHRIVEFVRTRVGD